MTGKWRWNYKNDVKLKNNTKWWKNALQFLAILLDALSIFSICIVLWVRMRHCSVTIVDIDVIILGHYCRIKITFIIMSQLWNLNYCRTCASCVFLTLRADVLCSMCVIVVLFGRLIVYFKLRINISCC